MPNGEFHLSEARISEAMFARPERVSLAAASMTAAPRFVEVGGKGIEVNITRNGGVVPSVVLNNNVIADIIGSITVRPRLKVLRQSVEAGRAIERGATVDLVLSEVSNLPGRIIDGIHPGLAELNMGELFTRFVDPNPDVTRILRTKTDPTALTTTERQTVAAALTDGGVTVDAADANEFGAAFAGLQAANLFGG